MWVQVPEYSWGLKTPYMILIFYNKPFLFQYMNGIIIGEFYILMFLRPEALIKDSFAELTGSRNIRVPYFLWNHQKTTIFHRLGYFCGFQSWTSSILAIQITLVICIHDVLRATCYNIVRRILQCCEKVIMRQFSLLVYSFCLIRFESTIVFISRRERTYIILYTYAGKSLTYFMHSIAWDK